MKKIFTISAILFSFLSQAQWSTVGTFDLTIQDMIVFNNQLYVGGDFVKFNNATCIRYGTYDGVTLTPNTTVIGGGPIKSFAIHNNTLYAAGGMDFGASLGVGKFMGGTLVGEGSFSSSHASIFSDGGTGLYAGSDFGTVSKRIDPAPWEDMGFGFASGENIYAITKYNNELIIGGEISQYQNSNMGRIARWDGTTWKSLFGGVGFGDVRCVAVFKGELYAGGDFQSAGGVTASGIAKWNGTSWTTVGGSITSNSFAGIRDLFVTQDYIYAVGDFTEMGGVAMNGVGRWSGDHWESLGFTFPASDYPNSVVVYNNELYVGLSSFSAATLHKRNVPVGENEITVKKFVSTVYPNPSSNILNVDFNSTNGNINYEIYSVQSEMIQQGSISSNKQIQIDDLKQGIYMIKFIAENGDQQLVRFAKQ